MDYPFDQLYMGSFPIEVGHPFLGLNNGSLFGNEKVMRIFLDKVPNYLLILKWGTTEQQIKYKAYADKAFGCHMRTILYTKGVGLNELFIKNMNQLFLLCSFLSSTMLP